MLYTYTNGKVTLSTSKQAKIKLNQFEYLYSNCGRSLLILWPCQEPSVGDLICGILRNSKLSIGSIDCNSLVGTVDLDIRFATPTLKSVVGWHVLENVLKPVIRITVHTLWRDTRWCENTRYSDNLKLKEKFQLIKISLDATISFLFRV